MNRDAIIAILTFSVTGIILFSVIWFLSTSPVYKLPEIVIACVSITSLYVAGKRFLLEASYNVTVNLYPVKFEEGKGETFEIHITNNSRNPIQITSINFYYLSYEDGEFKIHQSLRGRFMFETINISSEGTEAVSTNPVYGLIFKEIKYKTPAGKIKTTKRVEWHFKKDYSILDSDEAWDKLDKLLHIFSSKKHITYLKISRDELKEKNLESLKEKIPPTPEEAEESNYSFSKERFEE